MRQGPDSFSFCLFICTACFQNLLSYFLFAPVRLNFISDVLFSAYCFWYSLGYRSDCGHSLSILFCSSLSSVLQWLLLEHLGSSVSLTQGWVFLFPNQSICGGMTESQQAGRAPVLCVPCSPDISILAGWYLQTFVSGWELEVRALLTLAFHENRLICTQQLLNVLF